MGTNRLEARGFFLEKYPLLEEIDVDPWYILFL
jgi:hypothetical protein